MKKILILSLSLLAFAFPAFAEDDEEEIVVSQGLNLIDVPTSQTLDKYVFHLDSRLYTDGGTQVQMSFGVHDRITLGTSFLIDGLIGNESKVRMRTPEINVKFRIADGGLYIPSFAIGYEGQGYFYDSDRKEYMEEKKGLYLVASYELLPLFFLNGGTNISDFDDNRVFAFTGLSWKIKDNNSNDILALMAEYDNLFHHTTSYERLNAGIRFFITSEFSLDLAVRDINYSGTYKNGAKRHAERILQIHYDTRF